MSGHFVVDVLAIPAGKKPDFNAARRAARQVTKETYTEQFNYSLGRDFWEHQPIRQVRTQLVATVDELEQVWNEGGRGLSRLTIGGLDILASGAWEYGAIATRFGRLHEIVFRFSLDIAAGFLPDDSTEVLTDVIRGHLA